MTDTCARIGLLDAITNSAKESRSIDASFVTTFSLNPIFYEEVLLRAFERAGSRLNILVVDASQLAKLIADPIRRPQRAGHDYILLPVPMSGAFHPKIVALLSAKRPLLAIGSHNATDCGFARNEELTGIWGHDVNGVPRDILTRAISQTLKWVGRGSEPAKGLIEDITKQVERLCSEAANVETDSESLIISTPDGPSLLDQLSTHVTGAVKKVWVVSPYFDTKLDFLREVSDRWSPQVIIVGLQPASAVLLRPDQAPRQTLFVDVGCVDGLAQQSATGSISFVHGKLLAIETDTDFFLVVGSPNASAPAWLNSDRRNAEAAVVLAGKAARLAFEKLGLEKLSSAPQLSQDSLAEVARRSKALRDNSSAEGSDVPTIAGHWTGTNWFLEGLNADQCKGVTYMAEPEQILPTSHFIQVPRGAEMRLSNGDPDSGIFRVDSASGLLAYVVLNSPSRTRNALRPKGASRLLDSLGRIDSYEGFEELFTLFEQHVLNDDLNVATVRASKKGEKAGDDKKGKEDDEKPFGPRGVSLPTDTEVGSSDNSFVHDDYIADFISKLIHDLAPPASTPPDGDDPDIDPDDREEPAPPGSPPSPHSETPTIDWARLVTACRKRVSVLITRLTARLETRDSSPERAAWLAGRTLTVLLLLQKLRQLPPPEGAIVAVGRRIDSLVSVDQLRRAFKISLRAMYGQHALAPALQRDGRYRGARDRQLLDDVLFWISREIGFDFDMSAPFNEPSETKLARLRDRADALIVSMSAAGAAGNRTVQSMPQPRAWSDQIAVSPTWVARHLALGEGMQSALAQKNFPLLNKSIQAGDVVIWKAEFGFPRMVLDAAGKVALLAEPGDDEDYGVSKKIRPDFLSVIDVQRLRPQP
jgi:hypothetical protein